MHDRASPGDETATLLSVVIPVLNEAENVETLAREVRVTLKQYGPFEIIFVDDASTDSTAERILAIRQHDLPEIRLLRHSLRCGQSIAVWNGVKAARAEWIVTLDGDGQNDPADIPELLKAREEGSSDLRLIMGNRKGRQDSWIRRVSSRVAYGVRNSFLHDETPDTGCGIKLFHRDTFLSLPVFDHMHRFLPALFQRAGTRVISVGVHHRPRLRGYSKYGVWNRLWVGIVDLFGVRWLIRRAPTRVGVEEI